MIYLVSHAQAIASSQFVFTDGHPIMAFSSFFSDLKQLSEVDWGVMKSYYWNDIPDDPDRKRRRQAEFLIHQSFDIALVDFIAVKSTSYQHHAQRVLKDSKFSINVRVTPKWYY